MAFSAENVIKKSPETAVITVFGDQVYIMEVSMLFRHTDFFGKCRTCQ